MDLYTVFLCIFLLISPIVVQGQDEDLTEIVTASPDLNAGSTILPTNDTFNEFCKLPFEVGNGTDSVERFYYDFTKKACFNFTFKGESGNQNNFGSENDCLEQCYIEVGEAVLLKETDVIIIAPRSIGESTGSEANKCSKPSNEKCSETKVQRFYYSDEWQACFAFKACSKNEGYASRHECESSCKPMDGSVCGPETEPISATKMGQDCSNTECPSGSICLQGMIPQCCNEESRKDVDNLYNDKCENGQNAAGASTEYFLPTVAKSCEELVCDIGHECKTVGKFAKCCLKKQKSKPDHRDSPIYEAFHQDFDQKETSIMTQLHTPAALNVCRQPKEIGNCSRKIQSFYYDPNWQSCFAFKYSGCYGNDNRFTSRVECENQCVASDGSICRGPNQPALPIRYTNSCSTTICPYDYNCFMGMKGPECCHGSDQEKFKSIYDEKCPNNRVASGKFYEDYFAVTFGKSCSDLRCPYGYSCEQIEDDLAKCCQQTPFISKDQPLNSGSTRVNEKCPGIERRLVKTCGQILTDMEVVRRIWLSPRIISAEGIIQHLNTMCAKYDEYKSCLTTMTSNAACLDPVLSRKEQMFGFICQKKIRETVSSTDNQRCLRRISKIRKIRECEDNLEDGLINNVFDKFSVCKAFDRTLECSSAELLKCGPNTFSLMKNIITTLKSNIKECNRRFIVEEDDSVEKLLLQGEENESEKTTQQPRVSATKTLVASEGASARAKKHDSCSQRLIEKAEACTYLISFRKIREIFRFQNDFVLANFEIGNINEYCNHSQSYRKCMELSLSQDENCLVHLKNDPFYSFIVAFDDRLCERDKQLNWLINAGCLADVIALNKTKDCLEDLETTDGRILCKTIDQMENCIYPKIQTECRLLEANFFTEIYNMMQKRQRFCTPLNSTILGALRARFLSQLAQQDESIPRPLSINGCGSSRRISIFVDHDFVPECDNSGKYKHTQCDKKSGMCWCVDISSGMPIRGSKVGPGRPLPLCGLNYLFTCEKLPRKKYCDADRTNSQKMERWYRKDDKCVRYLFDYCPSSAHIPPMPLRTQNACQSFCLPLNG